jgi:hypothetical protein
VPVVDTAFFTNKATILSASESDVRVEEVVASPTLPSPESISDIKMYPVTNVTPVIPTPGLTLRDQLASLLHPSVPAASVVLPAAAAFSAIAEEPVVVPQVEMIDVQSANTESEQPVEDKSVPDSVPVVSDESDLYSIRDFSI